MRKKPPTHTARIRALELRLLRLESATAVALRAIAVSDTGPLNAIYAAISSINAGPVHPRAKK